MFRQTDLIGHVFFQIQSDHWVSASHDVVEIPYSQVVNTSCHSCPYTARWHAFLMHRSVVITEVLVDELGTIHFLIPRVIGEG